jgi:osmoprotectant transport system ATP-binding protein
MINRLIEHDQGKIYFAGEEIQKFKPQDLRRRMGYAIQSIGLFPHWTVEENIATVPQLLKWPRARIRDRVTELLELLHLEPDLFRHRYPHQLSGGQQQRVGVARALAADPEVLLMDEPFGALDPVTRAALQAEIARIHHLSGRTIVLVTHDIDEALALADRIVLLDQGRIVQQGTPLALLTAPVNDFVRDFFGRSDRGIKLLSLGTVAERVRPGHAEGEPITAAMSLREALSVFVARSTECLPVIGDQGEALGVLHFSDLITQKALS